MADITLDVLAAQQRDIERRLTQVEANQRTDQLARIDERTANMDQEFKNFRVEVRQEFKTFSDRVEVIKARSTTAIITVLCSTVVGVLALIIGRAVS